MKKIENFYKSRDSFTSFCLGILFLVFSILGMIIHIFPQTSEILSSETPLHGPWIKDFSIFGILFVITNLFFDHYFWSTGRTKRVLTFFDYFIGGILASFVFGTLLIIVLLKLISKDFFNLYLYIPALGIMGGFILCVILHWKKSFLKKKNSFC